MGDEPRRSGRATKGQHTKNLEAEVQIPARPTKPRPKKRAKGDEEEGEDGDAIIRCVCGAGSEDSSTGGMMVCCDKCSCWQHNRCMGFPQDAKALPENYLCERCDPENHRQLLEKMARGEKPWEGRGGWKRQQPSKEGVRAKNSAAAKKQASPSKEPPNETANASKDVSKARGQVTAEMTAPKKRKSRAEDMDEHAGDGVQGPQAKVRKVQDPSAMSPPPPPPPKADTSNPKQTVKAAAAVKEPPNKAAQKARQEINQTELVTHWKELQNQIRRTSAEHFAKKVEGVISEDVAKGKYSIPQGSTVERLGMRLGLEVERAVHLRFSNVAGDPPAGYRQRVRTLAFNLGKNHALCEGLVRGTLSPDVLSQMSTEALASEELQKRDAEMRREAEKQHILVKEEGPRIRRTHKGEEIVGADNEREANESVFAVPAPRRRESMPNPDTPVTASSAHAMSPLTPQSRTFSNGPGIAGNSTAASPTEPRALAVHTQGLSGAGENEKKPSATFNVEDVWSSVQPSDDQKSRRSASSNVQHLPYETPTPIEGGGNVVADPEIDELLKGEEAESPPYSPTEYPFDPSVVWRGKVSMHNVAGFPGTAKHVAGADLSATVPWTELIPENLRIDGRIVVERATNYLCELRYSRTTDVIVIAIRPAGGSQTVTEFERLWTYFHSRDRYGVVAKNSNPAVKDTYVIPVEAGSGKLPIFMEMLEHNTLEEPRPERILLVTFVLKITAASVARESSQIAASPVEPGTPTPGGGVAHGVMAVTSAVAPTASQSPPYDPATQGSNNHNGGVAGIMSNPSGQIMPPPYDGSYDMPRPVAAPNGQAPLAAVNPAMAISPPPVNPFIVQLLGPLVDSAVMRQLLANSPHIGPVQAQVIKEILERVPAARDDINLFTQLLTEKTRAEGR